MQLIPLPAFTDNYLWLWHDGIQAVVVDPGDSVPVFEALETRGLKLHSILVTHHHGDHVGGVEALRLATGARVYGPRNERNIPQPYSPVADGEIFQCLSQTIQVLDVPGHTSGHIAFFLPDFPLGPVLFCGDTLFSGGCGRLFEGTATQMLNSLDRLTQLPDATRVCCAHEYTLSNLKFAQLVEPDNLALQTYTAHCKQLRDNHLPTLPSNMALEKNINPFLRSRQPNVVNAVRDLQPSANSESEIFAALREWKNKAA